MTPRFWKNFSLIAANNVLGPLVAVVLVLIISRLSGPRLLGKYSLLTAILVIGQSCASLGFSVIVTRETARASDRAGTYFVSASAVGLTAMVLVLMLAVPALWLVVPDHQLRIALVLVLFALLPSVVTGNAEALLLGLEETRPFVVIALAERVAATAAGTVLVMLGYDIVGIAAVILGLRVLAAAWSLAVLRQMRVALTSFDFELCRRLVGEIPLLASIPVINAIYSRLDVLLVGTLRGFGDLGVYSAAARLVDVARVVPMAYARAIYPVFSRLHHEGPECLTPAFRNATRTLVLLMTCVAVVLASSAAWLIDLLYGPSFRNASSVLRLLSWSVVPFSVASLFAQVLFAANLARLDLRVNAISVLFNAALTLAAVPRGGVVGAAVAALASSILYAVLEYGYVASRVTKPLLVDTLTRITAAAMIGWAAAWTAHRMTWPPLSTAGAALFGYAVALIGSGMLRKQDLLAARGLLQPFDSGGRGRSSHARQHPGFLTDTAARPPLTAAVPTLGIVVVARNEEAHINRCIAASLATASRFTNCQVVLVDSRSTDRTVELARCHPIAIARVREGVTCTAALGRAIGQALTTGRYVLFVDGDSEVNPDWAVHAVAYMDSHPSVAAVGGRLREIYYRHSRPVGSREDFFGSGPAPEDAYQVGGNAMYRRDALAAVGSFNVGMCSHEEAELAERLRQAGYRLVRLPYTVAVHHTAPREGLDECWRRLSSGLQTGFGQVLRLTAGTPLFWAHLRQLNRYVLCLVFLLLGLAGAMTSVAFRDARYLSVWLACAVTLTTILLLRRGNIRHSVEILADWVFAAPAICSGFLRRPPSSPQLLPEASAMAELIQSGLPPPQARTW